MTGPKHDETVNPETTTQQTERLSVEFRLYTLARNPATLLKQQRDAQACLLKQLGATAVL